jgi:hypothetical protein
MKAPMPTKNIAMQIIPTLTHIPREVTTDPTSHM